jgi:endonuclease G
LRHLGNAWTLLACCLLTLGPAACDDTTEVRPAGVQTPVPAQGTAAARPELRIERTQYVLGYNPVTRTPSWVSWTLRRSDIGNAERGPFEADPLLPRQSGPVHSHIYNGSGFDRGHMCPAKDRSATQSDCDSTFFMSNVVPQSPACNQHGWERLESYCRSLASSGRELHIVCGPHGVGGTGKNGFREQIGKGAIQVTVPSQLWKVIVVLPYEGAAPHSDTRVIAVIMPNDQTVEHDWTRYRVSPRAVETLTGYRFLNDFPEPLATELRDRVDRVPVPVPGRATVSPGGAR